MGNIKKLKHALQNPPPERLAKVEYKSHLYQAFGIMFVCGILIYKGYWYIIFAFIFGIGISYSQGMSAYHRYKTIVSLTQPEKIEDYERDISPSRRRSKIIKSVMGMFANLISIVGSVVIAMLLINPYYSRWLLVILYPIIILVTYIVLYFFVFYWISYPIYKRRVKNEFKKSINS